MQANTAARRRYSFPGRTKRILIRFSPAEYGDVAVAAARAGLTTTSYAAETVLAATHGATLDGQQDGCSITRAELARLQRDLFAIRTALNRVGANLERVASMVTTGSTPTRSDDEIAACAQTAARVDQVTSEIDRKLRRSRPPGEPSDRRTR